MPETLHLRSEQPEDVANAARILRAGGLVAFPTETVYGLGANALSAEAVSGIFSAKQRPSWDPLIVHLQSVAHLPEVASIATALRERVDVLGQAFWPGPLTLLLPRTAAIPDAVTAGRELVGVRVPAHPVAQTLLKAVGLPLAAPSANRFGHTSPTTAQHVLDDLRGRIDAVLDGGRTSVGVESTVLDPSPTPMVLYREGAVTAEMLRSAVGVEVAVYSVNRTLTDQAPESLPSPGVGLRHYAPEARLLLSGPSAEALQQAVGERALLSAGEVGVLLPRDWVLASAPSIHPEPWGRWDDPSALAAELFAGLRALEAWGVTEIVCPLPLPGGLRDAIRDRLLKAAAPR